MPPRSYFIELGNISNYFNESILTYLLNNIKFNTMLKRISKLGTALNKTEQTSINGGKAPLCPYPLKANYNPYTRSWSCR